MDRDQILEVVATVEAQLDVITTELVKLPVTPDRTALGAVNQKLETIKANLTVVKSDLIELKLEGDEKEGE